MSDIIKIGGTIARSTVIGKLIQIFGASGIPQKIVVQVFTDVLTNTLGDLLSGKEKKPIETLTKNLLGQITQPSTFNISADAYLILIEIVNSPEIVTKRFSRVPGQPDKYYYGGVSFDYAKPTDGLSSSSLLPENAINWRQSLFICPRDPKPAQLVHVYVDAFVTANVYELIG